MSSNLYPYYERELLFIRQFAQEFAKQYPATANRLLLEPGGSSDPHTERLIESFALLAARVHHKLDDEFPELTDALLTVLYPHYLSPIPSMAIVEFVVDAARANLPDGFLIDRDSVLRTNPVNDLPCKYRTTYPVTLWPVVLTNAALLVPPFPIGYQPPPRTAAALSLQFEVQGDMRLSDLSLDRLRFFLSGDNQVVAALYELIFNHTLQVVFRSLDYPAGSKTVALPAEQCLFQVGFERDEGMLPYPPQSFLGYRLLTEFFTFPSKFLFVDLAGFQQAAREGIGSKFEVVLFLNRRQPGLEQGVDAQTFRLGCTPAVNLFEQIAEPIRLTQSRFEYRIVPDVAHPLGMEVYSVNSVTSVDPESNKTTEYQPFYSFRHGQNQDNLQTFWYAPRKPATRENDRGTDVYLHLVDLGFNPRLPAESTLIVRTTCSNRNLPAILQRAGDQLALELDTAAPVARIRCPRPPTLPLQQTLGRGSHWRLISHLSLNHLSLSDPYEARAALQEILRLYDFSSPETGSQLASVTRLLIEGIQTVSSRRVVERTSAGAASGFAHGVEVTIEFDEQKYIGTGVILFASVLERFLSLYASINSFTQLIARTTGSERYIKKWPPRAGEHPML